jgi:SAM-dependent MidA family methyltransferase
MPLPDLIIDKISREGPLSFRDFMEMALYYPGEGYYMAQKDRIGQSGDFYTSPYLTHLFGEMLAAQIEEMWRNLDGRSFTIVEYGAGTGLLCSDILHRLKANPECWNQLHYVIIEKSDWMRQNERRLLTAEGFLDKVSWVSSIRDLPPVTGCILSNELVDNFAVHQVVMEDELMEVFVGYDNGFMEVLLPASEALNNYLEALQVTLPVGHRAEINLEATAWIKEVSNALREGFVMTIDYGNSSSALYNQQHNGTLVCYHRHTINHSPYQFIGEQDITCHVNFSALDHWGRLNGLAYCGFTSQGCFLRGLGLSHRLRELETAMTPHQLYTLLVDMKFKVLIQRKGIGRKFLSGLQFSQVLA